MLVLMLGITPKSLLHELFANHEDIVACNDVDLNGPCIHKQGFNCEQSDLVAPSAFILAVHSELTHSTGVVSKADSNYSSFILSNKVFVAADRGPPAHV
ncbi:MAG: hypothetical protein JNK79_11330 [Chitinophagaceae bacterium]|nr:hypothetical protein [Chitinophagaceae bacterium]